MKILKVKTYKWISYEKLFKLTKPFTGLIIGLMISTTIWAQTQNVSLCNYQLEGNYPTNLSIPNNLSGVTYNSETQTLFMVRNGPEIIYETTLQGAILRTITLTGFDDTEGIVHISGSRFAVTEEKRGRITFIDILANTTNINYVNADYVKLPDSFGPWNSSQNKGLEGVSYNPEFDQIHTVKEIKDYYAFNKSVTFPTTLNTGNTFEVCNTTSDPFNLSDFAGIHHIGLTYNQNTEVLLLSEQSKKLVHLDANCTELGSLSLFDMNQPEGVTMDGDGNIYVVGEPNQLSMFKPVGVIGSVCNDGDNCTLNDLYNDDCDCVGMPISNCGSCRYTDSLALIKIYESLKPNHNWDLSLPIDQWPGVQAINENGCIDRLNLLRRGLTGVIPPEIGDLSEITSINMLFNNISGAIPSEIGNLTKLKILNLGYNNMTGAIPNSIGNLNNLQILYLAFNQFTEVPANIGNLSNLRYLFLRNNQLSGCYPNEFMQLCDQLPPNSNRNFAISDGNNFNTTWEDFCATGNGGCVQSNCHIDDWTALKAFYENTIGDNWNNSTGWDDMIANQNKPPTNCDLSGLEGIGLNDNGRVNSILFLSNNLHGAIPTEIGMLNQLEGLYIYYNPITGQIPKEIGQLTSLKQLVLYNNELSGAIPIQVGKLINLVGLSLSKNNLTGEIPSEIGNLHNLESLYLNDNQLTGGIPTELAGLNKLLWLAVANNQLSGCYAGELAQLCNQVIVDLYLTNAPGSPVDGVSYGNNFDAEWKDFCATGNGGCETTNEGREENVPINITPIELDNINLPDVFEQHEIQIAKQQSEKPKLYVNKRSQSNDFESLNYPNPFSIYTNINFTLAQEDEITLSIYDSYGNQVALLSDKEKYETGKHVITFDGPPPNIVEPEASVNI